MKIVLVSKCSLDIEQYVEFKMSVLISPSKSLISLRWVTYRSSSQCESVHKPDSLIIALKSKGKKNYKIVLFALFCVFEVLWRFKVFCPILRF